MAAKPDPIRRYREKLAVNGQASLLKRVLAEPDLEPTGRLCKTEQTIRGMWMRLRRSDNPTSAAAELFFPFTADEVRPKSLLLARESLLPDRAISFFASRPESELPYAYYFVSPLRRQLFLTKYFAATGKPFPLEEARRIWMKALAIRRHHQSIDPEANLGSSALELNAVARQLILADELKSRGLCSIDSVRNILRHNAVHADRWVVANFPKVRRAVEHGELAVSLECVYFLLPRFRRSKFRALLGQHGLALDAGKIEEIWTRAKEQSRSGEAPWSPILTRPDAKVLSLLRQNCVAELITRLRLSSQSSLARLLSSSNPVLSRALSHGTTDSSIPIAGLKQFLGRVKRCPVAIESVASLCSTSVIDRFADWVTLSGRQQFSAQTFNQLVAAAESDAAENRLGIVSRKFRVSLARKAAREAALDRISASLGDQKLEEALKSGLYGLEVADLRKSLLSIDPQLAVDCALAFRSTLPSDWLTLCANNDSEVFREKLKAAGLVIKEELPAAKKMPRRVRSWKVLRQSADLSKNSGAVEDTEKISSRGSQADSIQACSILGLPLEGFDLDRMRKIWFRDSAKELGIQPRRTAIAAAFNISQATFSQLIAGNGGLQPDGLIRLLAQAPKLDRSTASCLIAPSQRLEFDLKLSELLGANSDLQKLTELRERGRAEGRISF